ncbi:MAG: amidohydrolase family protein [Verrucomicrobiota bacterium]
MRIDSHHHFWDYDAEAYAWIGKEMEVLKRDFGPIDLASETEAVGIEGVVSVQARQDVEETSWLLKVAEQHPWIKGVVGWVPLQSPKVEAVLDSLASASLCGVRHVVQGEADDEFLLRDEFNRGVLLLKDRGLVYDILIYARQLPQTIPFVDRHPEQPFVVDHIAKPVIEETQFDTDWEKHIRALAERPQVYCKFSGVVTEVVDSEWSLELIRPYWDVVLNAFGPERLLFGSDWPVCLLRASYGEWFSLAEALAEDLSEEERAHFFGENAVAVYGL